MFLNNVIFIDAIEHGDKYQTFCKLFSKPITGAIK